MSYTPRMADLPRGARDLVRGLDFLRAHPRLWAYVIAPAVITAIVLVGVIVLVARLAGPLVDRIASATPAWLDGWIAGALWVLVIAALAVPALLVFVSVVGVVAGPFNELLSEAIEARVTGRPAPRSSLLGFVRGAVVGLVHGLRRLAAFGVGAVAVFALGLVPVVGTIAGAALGGYLGARAAAWDCYDAVLSRRELSYEAKSAYLRAHRGRTLGLGLAVLGLLLVPVVNLVALGLGAAGATLAALEIDGAPDAQIRTRRTS